MNNYNARDQVILTRQYQGSENSGTHQDTIVTYDGYGRLKSKHVPEQDANAVTTYNYNDDDTSLSVVDARGASQTFGYNNNRQLVTYVYQPDGRRSFSQDSTGTRFDRSYKYDHMGRITEALSGAEARNEPATVDRPLATCNIFIAGLTQPERVQFAQILPAIDDENSRGGHNMQIYM